MWREKLFLSSACKFSTYISFSNIIDGYFMLPNIKKGNMLVCAVPVSPFCNIGFAKFVGSAEVSPLKRQHGVMAFALA